MTAILRSDERRVLDHRQHPHQIARAYAMNHYQCELPPRIRSLTFLAKRNEDLTQENIRNMVKLVSQLLWASKYRGDADGAVSDADYPSYRLHSIQLSLEEMRKRSDLFSKFLWKFSEDPH